MERRWSRLGSIYQRDHHNRSNSRLAQIKETAKGLGFVSRLMVMIVTALDLFLPSSVMISCSAISIEGSYHSAGTMTAES